MSSNKKLIFHVFIIFILFAFLCHTAKPVEHSDKVNFSVPVEMQDSKVNITPEELYEKISKAIAPKDKLDKIKTLCVKTFIDSKWDDTFYYKKSNMLKKESNNGITVAINKSCSWISCASADPISLNIARVTNFDRVKTDLEDQLEEYTEPFSWLKKNDGLKVSAHLYKIKSNELSNRNSDINNYLCYKINIGDLNNLRCLAEKEYYFDSKTMLLRMNVMKSYSPASDGKLNKRIYIFTDYKRVDGVLYNTCYKAVFIDNYNGKTTVSSMFVNREIEANSNIEDSVFNMPEKVAYKNFVNI